MDTKEALELLDQTNGFVGDDEALESLTANLITLKDFLGGIDVTIDELQEDVARLNEKNRQLMASNNNLYRQLSQQEDKRQEAKEKVSDVDAILDALAE